MNAKEYEELWKSLTPEEQLAVMEMKRRQVEEREQEFYAAKGRSATKKET